MIKLPLVGPAYKLNAQSMSCQNCINWYPQTIEYPNGSRVAALMPTPGLKRIFQGDSASVRCLHVLSNGALLAVIGKKLYHSKSNKFELIEVGLISALNTVQVADNGRVAIIVNGTYSYSLDLKTLALSRLSGSSIPRSTHVLFLDGRFVVNKANTGQFYWSDLYSDKFNALSYATAESSPDNITALVTFNRELWIFGAQTVERYYSTGSSNSPYARLSGGAMAFGCTAPDSIIALATGVIWLSLSEFGGHQIVMSSGGVPERISTHAIEEEISSFSKTGDAIAYAYQQEGHVFYVISFPSANVTFCYDVSTGLWHQRSFANAQGLHERHRSQHHAFYNNIHIVGDYSNGKLYQLDKQTFTDDGELILRERTAQAVITDGKITRFNNLEIVCETGFSISDTSSAPQPPEISCDGATQIASFRMAFPKIGDWNLLYNDPLNFLGFADMEVNGHSVGADIEQWQFRGVDVVVIGLWNGSPPTGTQEWINGALVEFKPLSAVENRVKFQSIFVENFNTETNPTIGEIGFKSYGFCLAPKSNQISCDGATDFVNLSFAIRIGTTPTPDIIFIVDGVDYISGQQPPSFINVEFFNEPPPVTPPEGFELPSYYFRFSNLSGENHTLGIKADGADVRVVGWGNPTVTDLSEGDTQYTAACLSN